MTPDQAAWVRTNVWTQPMRKTHREVPGAAHHCACQYGTTTWCQEGHHDRCHRATPLPFPDAYIVSRGGGVAYLPQPYRHQHLTATGKHETSAAMVWLADRICRWVCDCPCGHPAPAVVPVQEELFEGVGA